jgi:ubiquitin carboxyl-terminal hydrolase L3
MRTAPGSFLQRFFEATGPLDPAQRGAYLESPPSDAPDIEDAHQVRRAQSCWLLLCVCGGACVSACMCGVLVVTTPRLPAPPRPRARLLHQAAGQRGSTAPPPPEQDVDLHFIAFVEHGGQLWELDGRRAGPISHGPTTSDSLLPDVAAVAKAFIDRCAAVCVVVGWCGWRVACRDRPRPLRACDAACP